MMLNQNMDEDEDDMINEQVKIRVLDGPNNKFVPEEFKNSLVFHHPIRLIKDWSFNNVFKKNIKQNLPNSET